MKQSSGVGWVSALFARNPTNQIKKFVGLRAKSALTQPTLLAEHLHKILDNP